MLPKLINWLKDHLISTNNVHGSSAISKPNALIESDISGKINKSQINETSTIQSTNFKSAGVVGNTGYLLSDDTDISTLFKTITEVTEESVGTGVVSDIQLKLENSKLHIKLIKTNVVHCTYCTHCDVVEHCTYCTYCAYCW